jgi:hypothetical protein
MTLPAMKVFVLCIGVTVAAFVAGYAFAGVDDPVSVVSLVTATSMPLPTATDVAVSPTLAPTEFAGIRFLPDCTEPDTPSGSLCVYGSIAYPTCDPEVPASREPCYKP